MPSSLCLINPRSEVATYFGGEAYEYFGFEPAQSIADLATATVAAMAPADWQVEICEEYVQPVDLDHPAEFIGLTVAASGGPALGPPRPAAGSGLVSIGPGAAGS